MWRGDFRATLPRMSRPEPEERLVYAQVVEGLIKHGLKGRLTPRLAERLRTEGIDVDRPVLPAYPVATWNRCLNAIVEEDTPELEREQAFRELGTRMVEGLGETLVGKALYAMLRLIGPRRMVQRLPRDLAGSDNYTNAIITEVGPNAYRLEMNSNPNLPGYPESLFVAMLRVSGAKEPSAEVIRQTDSEVDYLLRWK